MVLRAPIAVVTDLLGRRLATSALLLVAGLSAGCTTIEFEPPPEAVRQKLRSAVITARPAAATEAPVEPAKDAGSGVSRGARRAATGSMVVGLEFCGAFFGVAADMTLPLLICGATVPVGVVISPFAALFGAAVGPAMARPKAEVEAAQGRLVAALTEVDAGRYLRDRLVAIAAEQGGVRLATRAQQASSKAAAGPGGGMLLEIAVTDFRLNTLGDFEPDVVLEIGARARLVRAADGHELYWHDWRYLGPQRTYFDAADDGARVLRWDVREGFERLADKMVFDLLIGASPDVVFNDRQRPGTVETVATSGS